MSAPRRLVIFDCDGVLVDSERISNAVLAEMLADEGLELTLEQARARFQGRLLADVAALAGEELGRPLPEGWIGEYERHRERAFRAELAPVPGAAELVEAVRRAGLAVCVASQGSLAKTALSLSLTGLDGLFEPAARFSAAQVARGKPAPDLFLFAARSIGCEPRACAVVEDTPSGVTAAVRAGMDAYGYAADSDARALREAGARVVVALAQLEPLLLGDEADRRRMG
jgi:HAD superfamily hydrolase (TIGR01509 family)